MSNADAVLDFIVVELLGCALPRNSYRRTPTDADGDEALDGFQWSAGLRTTVVAVVAMLVGASVSAQVAIAVQLNARSSLPLHAMFISLVTAALSASMLAVPAACSMTVLRSPDAKPPAVAPGRRWVLLGGIATLPSVVSIPASRSLGVQAAMLSMLVGQVGTGLAMDVAYTRSTRLGPRMLVGVAIVFVGVLVNELGVTTTMAATSTSASASTSHDTTSSDEPFDALDVVYVCVCVVAGAGYALQTLCNRELARDLDDGLGAAWLSIAITALALAPLCGALWASGAVAPQIHLLAAPDGYLWALCGLQFLVYACATAIMPRFMPYTQLFLCGLIGQLACSSAIDASGLGGVRHVPFGAARAAGLALVALGYAIYSRESNGHG